MAPTSAAPIEQPDHNLLEVKGLLAMVRQAREDGDFTRARAAIVELADRALKSLGSREDEATLFLLEQTASLAHAAGEFGPAERLRLQVLETRSRTKPETHRDLQAARVSLAVTRYALGELEGARVLLARAVEVLSSAPSEEQTGLQTARMNLAVVLGAQGEMLGARLMLEQVVESYSKTLPDDHPELLAARSNLSTKLFALGDLERAQALQEQVLSIRSRTLPEEHPDLQRARGNLAATLFRRGDLLGARALQERSLQSFEKTLPGDHPDLQRARQNLAGTLLTLGDLARANGLYAQVLEINARTLPEEHPDLQRSRQNLAVTLRQLGELEAARSLEERVLAVLSTTLSDEHPDLQLARQNLALTLQDLGDIHAARALEEQVLDVLSRTRAEDDPELQRARGNLALTMEMLGDLVAARVLREEAFDAWARTLPEDHPDLQDARSGLASSILMEISRDRSATGLVARAVVRGADARWERAASLLEQRSLGQARVAREVRLNSPGREAEERCDKLATGLDFMLSVALGYGGLEPLAKLTSTALSYSEATRNAGVSSSGLAHRASASTEYADLRQRLRGASADLARLGQRGTGQAEYQRALLRREQAELALLELGRAYSRAGAASVELDARTVAAVLGPGEAAVAYRRFSRFELSWVASAVEPGVLLPQESSVESLCAFVIRPSAGLTTGGLEPFLSLIDLGPLQPVQAATDAWRAGLGSADGRGARVESGSAVTDLGPRGAAIRRLVFDPLRAALGSAQRVVFVLDDVLHLVPFDALPVDEDGTRLLGDRMHIETRATLAELLDGRLPVEGPGAFVGIGGVAYGDPGGRTETSSAPSLAGRSSNPPQAGGGQSSTLVPADERALDSPFGPLPATLAELDALRATFEQRAESSEGFTLLCGELATKAACVELAPRARWLHIATHGWYSSEAAHIREDRSPIEQSTGLGMRRLGADTISGMSPMLLTGLALAGANQPPDVLGQIPGRMTAEELSSLDLSNCELAVLSACDTARGDMHRAGQGVASLQKALQIAGARSVIASLWRVPDEATKDLMIEFYRRLWLEKQPKREALWAAKRMLREAQDARGLPKYTIRDWAAWVLTGEQE